ncbi:MAG UNVERIFIED_CONTAM: PA14 domain-containing protein [Anaerolineae bacterium]
MNADNFSARMNSSATFNAGTYRFYLLVDDEARLSIDYQPVIDTFDKNVVGQVQTIDVVMTAGIHQIQIDYREAGGNAYVYLDWANTAQANPSVSFSSNDSHSVGHARCQPLQRCHPCFWLGDHHARGECTRVDSTIFQQ